MILIRLTFDYIVKVCKNIISKKMREKNEKILTFEVRFDIKVSTIVTAVVNIWEYVGYILF